MATPLERRLREARRALERDVGRRETVEQTVAAAEEGATRREEEAARCDKACELLQAATEARRAELRDRVESLVTRGLRAVFDREDFDFRFKVSLQRSAFGMVPMLASRFGDADLEVGIVDGHGGGVADVTSFLLRVIVLSLARPKVSRLLVLDESFRHVSPEYLRGVAGLLRELNRTADVQFVLVTHKPELLDAADVVYRAELVEGETRFHLEHDLRDEAYHSRPARGEDRGRDRRSAWDGQDMTAPVDDAESVEAPTTDRTAKRVRAKARERKRRKR